MKLQRDFVVPAVLGFLTGAILGGYIGSRSEVVTYTSFRIEPQVLASGDKATLYMSVTWNRPHCQVTVQQKVWSVDRTQTFSVDGPYAARMKDDRRVLLDKPRQIQMPILPPGEYLIGFDQVSGKCWPWEIGPLAISATPPTPAPFTVK